MAAGKKGQQRSLAGVIRADTVPVMYAKIAFVVIFCAVQALSQISKECVGVGGFAVYGFHCIPPVNWILPETLKKRTHTIILPMKKIPGWLSKVQGEALLLLAAIIWGTGFVAQRWAMDSMQPFAFIGMRFLLGCLVLLPGLILQRKKKQPAPVQPAKGKTAFIQNILPGVVPGLFLFAGTTMQQLGIMTTSAAKAGFLTSLYLVLVPLIGLFFGKKPNRWVWFGVVLALLGVFYLSVDLELIVNRGDILMIIGAGFWAMQILSLDYFSAKTDSLSLAFGQFLLAAVLGFVFSLVFEGDSLFTDSIAWGPLLYSGIFSVGIGFTLQVIGQSKVDPTLASLIMSLEAVFALLSGMLVLGERLAPREGLGSVLMMAAVIVVQLKGQQRKEIIEESSAPDSINS